MLRWGLVFLACPFPLPEEALRELVRVAAGAYFHDQDEATFELPTVRGALRSSSSAVAMGSFVGQQFEAEVHVPEGSGTVRFLVTEPQLRAARGEVAEA